MKPRLSKNIVGRLVKKVSAARRARNRSFGFAQDGLGGGVRMQYVGAIRSSATKQMSLFASRQHTVLVK